MTSGNFRDDVHYIFRYDGGIYRRILSDPAREVPIKPRHDLRNHSPDGFAWGYGGSGPSQAALAVMADFLGDDEQALALYQDFKWAFIAKMPDEGGTIRGEQIAWWMKQREAG